ncbi:MAG: hypothetical protein IJF18_06155 [Oscillospiraceae bacterium]|nr:hypothetical protein [Oscillospiraceae bacterium]
MDDWRLNGQEKYLENVNLKHIQFNNKINLSDHEHCEFCTDRISNYIGTKTIGYCTEDEYYWICEECYNDFKDIFHWKII